MIIKNMYKFYRNHLVLRFITYGLVFLILFSMFYYGFNLYQEIENCQSMLIEERDDFKNHINNNVLEKSLFLKGLNENFSLISISFTNRDIEFISNEISFIEKNTVYSDVYYIDLERGVLLSSNKIENVNYLSRYFNDLSWYESSLKYLRSETSRVLMHNGYNKYVALSIPIIDGENLLGYIIGKIDLDILKGNAFFNFDYETCFSYQVVDQKNEEIFNYNLIENEKEYWYNKLIIKLTERNTNYSSHVYDGSIFTYWKYNIHIDYGFLEAKVMDKFINFIFYFFPVYLLLLVLIYNIYVKYKKEILIDFNYNRKKQVERIKKHLKNPELFLFFFEVDNISMINNIYGYDFGNEVIIALAEEFLDHPLHDSDHFMYLGSDNFLSVIDFSNWEQARNYLDVLLEEYNSKELEVKGKKVKIKLNFILYRFDQQVFEIEYLEKHIDKVLRLLDLVFIRGSSNYSLYKDYSAVEKTYSEHIEIKNFLFRIIENEAVEPFIQPIVDLETKETYGYEVLMRIQDEDFYLAPYPYIKTAEKFNLIKKIDYIMIKKTMNIFSNLSEKPKVSFNLSSIELISMDHLKSLVDLIKSYNYPNIITFEITETKAIEDFSLIVENLGYLKKQGFNISLDDFGTGFSNLETLTKIENSCDYIKIDGSFIRNIQDKKQLYIVQSIVSLAKAFEKKVIAEFVEDKEVELILKDLGIHYGQGYLYSKPKKITELIEL